MLYVGRTDHGAHRKKTRLTMVCSMVRPMEKTCPLEQTVVLQPVGPCCPPWYIQWHLRDPRPSPWCTMGHGMVCFMVPDGASVDTSSMGQPTKKKTFIVFAMVTHDTFDGKYHDISQRGPLVHVMGFIDELSMHYAMGRSRAGVLGLLRG